MAFVETLYGHQSEINCIDSLRKERAVTAGGDRSVRLWKVVEESQLVFDNGHTASIDALTMIDEENFLTGGSDGTLCLWNTGKKRASARHTDVHSATSKATEGWGSEPRWVNALGSVRSSDLVASGSCDGNLNFWHCDVKKGSLNHCLAVPMEGFINGIAFGKSGRFAAAAVGQEHRLGRWGVQKRARNGLHLVDLQPE